MARAAMRNANLALRVLLELCMLVALAVAATYASGLHTAAALFALVFAIHKLLQLIWRQ